MARLNIDSLTLLVSAFRGAAALGTATSAPLERLACRWLAGLLDPERRGLAEPSDDTYQRDLFLLGAAMLGDTTLAAMVLRDFRSSGWSVRNATVERRGESFVVTPRDEALKVTLRARTGDDVIHRIVPGRDLGRWPSRSDFARLAVRLADLTASGPDAGTGAGVSVSPDVPDPVDPAFLKTVPQWLAGLSRAATSPLAAVSSLTPVEIAGAHDTFARQARKAGLRGDLARLVAGVGGRTAIVVQDVLTVTAFDEPLQLAAIAEAEPATDAAD